MIVYTQMFKPLICSFCRAREVSPQSDFVTLSLKPSITWYFSYLQYIASLSAVPRLPRGNDALLYPVRTFCPSCDNMSVTYDSSTLGSTKTSISTFTYDSNTPMVAVMAAGSAFLGELITLRLFDAQDLMYLGPNAAADPVWDIETGWYGWKWTKITEILDWIKNSCFICRAPLLTLPAFSSALFWSCCVFFWKVCGKEALLLDWRNSFRGQVLWNVAPIQTLWYFDHSASLSKCGKKRSARRWSPKKSRVTVVVFRAFWSDEQLFCLV